MVQLSGGRLRRSASGRKSPTSENKRPADFVHSPHRLFLNNHYPGYSSRHSLTFTLTRFVSNLHSNYTDSTSAPNNIMRSPALVVSLFAVSALSPSVYGSPLPNGIVPHANPVALDHHKASNGVAVRGLGFLNEVFGRSSSTTTTRAAPTSKPKVATIANLPIG